MPSPHPCRYPTDLSDAGWAVLEPLLPPPARTGRPWKWLRQLVVEAIFHLARSGCRWRMPPRCFPPWPTVFTHVRRWRLDRTPRRTRNRLGVQALVGRAPPGDLRALSRSGRTAPAPAPSPAGSRPSAAGASRCPSTGSARRGGTAWRVGALPRTPRGFRVVPRRRVVERTFAWLSRSRRLARDQERLPETGEAMVHAAMTRTVLRRIAA